MSSPISKPRRPVMNTYGRKVQTDAQPGDTQVASSAGMGTQMQDDDFYDDLELSKSLLAPKRRDVPTGLSRLQLDLTQVIGTEEPEEEEEDDDFDIPAPLTPRSKLKAQLSRFDSGLSSPTRPSQPVRAQPFEFIDEESEQESEGEKESDEAFLSRFRSKFLPSEKSASEPSSTDAVALEQSAPTQTAQVVERAPSPVSAKPPVAQAAKKPEPELTSTAASKSKSTIYDLENGSSDNITDDSDDDFLFANTSSKTTSAPTVTESEPVVPVDDLDESIDHNMDEDALSQPQPASNKKVSPLNLKNRPDLILTFMNSSRKRSSRKWNVKLSALDVKCIPSLPCKPQPRSFQLLLSSTCSRETRTSRLLSLCQSSLPHSHTTMLLTRKCLKFYIV